MEAARHTLVRVVASLLQAAPLSDGKVDVAWALAVGPQLRRVTSAKLVDTSMIVEAASPAWSDAVARTSGLILARLQATLGDNAVARIVVRAR